MKPEVKVGIIGLGGIAQNAYLPILDKMEHVQLKTFLSGTFSRAAQLAARYGVQNVVHTVDEMIKSDIDCAFVMSPKDYHAEAVVPLLSAGIDVFCEKPLAMTLDEIDQMVDASIKTGSLLMAGFNRRFSPVYQYARDAFENCVPDYIFGEKNRPDTEYRATMENAIHLVDTFRWFCGECSEVEAISRFDDPFFETLTAAQLIFKSGTVAHLGAHRCCGQWTEHMELIGNHKNVMIDFPDTIKIVDNTKETCYSMTPLSLGWADIKDKMGYRNTAAHFIGCVQSRKTPLTCGEDAYKTHELLDVILRKAGLPDLSRLWKQ
jgi:virulence factor